MRRQKRLSRWHSRLSSGHSFCNSKNAAADAGQTGDCGNRRQVCLGQNDPLLLYRAKDGIYGAASRPLFLQPHQRTPQRLAQPGGNVDYERFWQQVIVPLRQGVSFSYRPYDCSVQQLTDAVEVLPTSIVFVEGSYSCHPALWKGYDLHIFLTVQPTEQLRRIAIRNGQQGLKVFQERWIPLEERYFSAFSVQQRCELCFATD